MVTTLVFASYGAPHDPEWTPDRHGTAPAAVIATIPTMSYAPVPSPPPVRRVYDDAPIRRAR